MTDAERKFWSRVRNRALGGFKFVRQEPIGPYFAGFVGGMRESSWKSMVANTPKAYGTVHETTSLNRQDIV